MTHNEIEEMRRACANGAVIEIDRLIHEYTALGEALCGLYLLVNSPKVYIEGQEPAINAHIDKKVRAAQAALQLAGWPTSATIRHMDNPEGCALCGQPLAEHPTRGEYERRAPHLRIGHMFAEKAE